MERQIKKNKLENFIVGTSVNTFGNNLGAIYSYGSSNNGSESFGDLDLMEILNKFPVEKISEIQDLTSKLTRESQRVGIPLDLHIYGKDEIPSPSNRGYPIFTGFFQVDYLTHRKLLYGNDLLSKLPKINVSESAMDMLSSFRRVIRQVLINPNTTNVMARALFNYGGLDSPQDISVQNLKGFQKFLRYAVYISCKCFLESKKEHYISKLKNVERTIEKFPDLKKDILLIQESKHRNPKTKDFNHYGGVSLKIIDKIYEKIRVKNK